MNPWLDIPIADYESHMSMPTIGQALMIADQLSALITRFRPSSIAVVGCAGGNGFERVASTSVERVVGVDINPQYIELAAARYTGRIHGLELYVGDVQRARKLFEPVDLIYAALILEYVDVAQSMRSLARHCARDGVIASVVQLPHESKQAVTSSPYSSLQALAPAMKLVAPDDLTAHASTAGLLLEDSRTIVSPGGKHFAVQIFRAGKISEP
jgi:trans-aconitate methyltransferase